MAVKDFLFKIDNYNAPASVSGVDAWCHNILDLIFIEPGTYSDTPELGINLKSLTYMEVNSMIYHLRNELKSQASRFFPGIPLSDITIISQQYKNDQTALIITLTFSTKYGTISKSAHVSLVDELVDYIVDRFDNKNLS